jgi:hypothetical protein
MPQLKVEKLSKAERDLQRGRLNLGLLTSCPNEEKKEIQQNKMRSDSKTHIRKTQNAYAKDEKQRHCILRDLLNR